MVVPYAKEVELTGQVRIITDDKTHRTLGLQRVAQGSRYRVAGVNGEVAVDQVLAGSIGAHAASGDRHAIPLQAADKSAPAGRKRAGVAVDSEYIAPGGNSERSEQRRVQANDQGSAGNCARHLSGQRGFHLASQEHGSFLSHIGSKRRPGSEKPPLYYRCGTHT
jgi:hypothetical protein